MRWEAPAKANREISFLIDLATATSCLHFAPVLSCESKNGGFGRNDRWSFLQSNFNQDCCLSQRYLVKRLKAGNEQRPRALRQQDSKIIF